MASRRARARAGWCAAERTLNEPYRQKQQHRSDRTHKGRGTMILDRFRLDGKVAIVTGASAGIGRASALAFAEAGADVVCAARAPDRLDHVAAQIRGLDRRALAVPCDVNVAAQLEHLVATTVKEFGRVDILVNNAGGTPPTAALDLSQKDFEAAFH